MANKPTNAELQELLTDATNRAAAAEARVAQLTSDLSSANERADQERKGREEAERSLDAAREELRQANNSLKAYKGSATRARTEALILKRELSPEVRPIGAMKPARSDDEAAKRKADLEAAFAGGPTEIVFSDGRREIREIAALIVDANAWLQTPHHRELNDDPILEPAGERQQVELAGFALLNEAGEQVGWCPLPSPLAIGRGHKMRIPRGSIRF